MNGGYETGAEFILSGLPVTVEELKRSPLPVKIPGLAQYTPGSELSAGLKTGSGKIELSSTLLEEHPDWGVAPLPVYVPPIPETEREKYPFILCSGGSIPNALHSRLHDVPWLRSLRPDALAEINPADGENLGINDGDEVELYNDTGTVTLKARLTNTVPAGTVFTYHGYREANIEQLIPADALDPATGFPAYRSVGCHIRRVRS